MSVVYELSLLSIMDRLRREDLEVEKKNLIISHNLSLDDNNVPPPEIKIEKSLFREWIELTGNFAYYFCCALFECLRK